MSETTTKKLVDILNPLFHLWSSIRVSGMAVSVAQRWYNLGIRAQLLDCPLANPEIRVPDSRFLHYVIDYPLNRFALIVGQVVDNASFKLEKNPDGDEIAEILLAPTLTTPTKTAANIAWYGPTKREPSQEQRKSGMRESSITLTASGEMIHQLLDHDLRLRIDSKLRRADAPYDGLKGLAKYLFSGPSFEQWQQTLVEIVAGLPFEIEDIGDRKLRVRASSKSKDGSLTAICFYESERETKPVRSTLRVADANSVDSKERQWDIALDWPSNAKSAKFTLFYCDEEIQSIHVSRKQTHKAPDRLKPSLDRTDNRTLVPQTSVPTPPSKAARTRESRVFKTALETYSELEIVGQGGTGIVYKVETDDHQVFALKLLNAQKATTAKRKRFKTELHFCSNNELKNVVSVRDHGIIEVSGQDCPFYVMPFYPETLRDLMKKGISHDKILSLFSQILDGVEAAHLKGVWHRDLKPENILHDTTTDLLIVADFGIAHFGEEELYTLVETSAHDRLANFQYAAPEQRARGKLVDHRSDIFALGLILNELFTGHIPQGAGILQIGEVAETFGYLDEIVEMMIQQSPEKRPATINQIKETVIAKGNEFISRQKLDALRQTVIPASTVTDPLIDNPVRVEDVDIRGNMLVAILNQIPSPQWMRVFVHPRAITFIHGTEPANWRFSGNEAMVGLSNVESQAKQVLNHFRDYVTGANALYKESVELAALKLEEDQKRALAQQIAEEERRQRILKSLKD